MTAVAKKAAAKKPAAKKAPAAKPRAKKAAAIVEVVDAFKGFDKDLKCRDMQYAVGETFKHKGTFDACSSGLHVCTNPLDTFSYYGPATSRFCTVKVSGKLSRHEQDSKIAAGVLEVTAEIGVPGIITAAIKAIFALVQKPTSGDSAHSATSGDSAHSATSGDSAHSATSGHYAHSATSGYSAHSATSGYSAHSATSGAHSVAASVGIKGRAKASATGAICLTHFNNDRSIKHIRASKVGENGIKPDTWYVLNADGEFEEVQP